MLLAAYPSQRTTTDITMPAKNDHSDPRPVPAAPDEKPKKQNDKSSATGSAKAPARTRSASKPAASEAPEGATPKARRKATSAASSEPAAVKAAPRVRRPTRTAAVAATASAETVSAAAKGAADALDAHSTSDAPRAAATFEAEVRVRAYMLSLARGDAPGSPDADWYQAERELTLSRQQ